MGWISEMSDNLKRSTTRSHHLKSAAAATATSTTTLGILSFETAKTMTRILSLYNSLSDSEIYHLQTLSMKSQGVSYLNSKDDVFLWSLACAEKMEDLDRCAAAVGRLGGKCSDFGLNRFDMVYSDLKLGTIDLGKLGYGSRRTERRVDKMERLVSATSGLYSSLEALTELEISERKLNQWKKNCTPIQMKNMNFDVFEEKITHQRKLVRHYRQTSLWNKSFDKSVGLMARIVCIVYARICSVFASVFPSVNRAQFFSRSGPIISSTMKPNLVRFYSQKSSFSLEDKNDGGDRKKNNRVFHAAGPTTVGGSGLALRYANVILLAETYLDSTLMIEEDERNELYEMLPENLKASVRSKLSKQMKWVEEGSDMSLAEGWREALGGIMEWLAPMAHDTVKWQMERNFEKTKFDTKPNVLLLQTLHFSDKEKTEAVITEVLVGLSCIYRPNGATAWSKEQRPRQVFGQVGRSRPLRDNCAQTSRQRGQPRPTGGAITPYLDSGLICDSFSTWLAVCIINTPHP